jgi:hypothetical protein
MTIYLDIEILDWFSDPEIVKLEKWRQHASLRFGLATTHTESDGFQVWWPDQVAALYHYIRGADGPLVTWNGDEFDLPYLIVQAIKAGATIDPWTELPGSLDLMSLIRQQSKRIDGKERWYKLDVIAQSNLGRGKIGHGDEAAEWLRSGDAELVRRAAEYCQDDVQLVMDLHAKLIAGESLICPARPDLREFRELHIKLA